MKALIAAACRSPVAPRDGAFSDLLPHQLAAPVVQAVLRAAGLAPQEVDEIIVSNALGPGGNPARSVALAAGLPEHVAGLSIDRQCAGGMDAIILARQMILSGAAQVVVAGGVESYSRRPNRAHTFADQRPPEPYTQAPFTPWPERDPDMTEAAADLADAEGISREAQDQWAVASHAKALSNPAPADEIVALNGLPQDAFTRRLSLAICKRSPVISGSITAANAAVAADGAAFCVVASDRVAAQLNVPCTHIETGATLGADPTCPGLAPLVAIKRVLATTGLKPHNLTAAEVMEAYAVQAIACVQNAALDPEIVNRGGGALARGHPIGASGAINVVRLRHELITSGAGIGLGTIASAGGIGSALILRA